MSRASQLLEAIYEQDILSLLTEQANLGQIHTLVRLMHQTSNKKLKDHIEHHVRTTLNMSRGEFANYAGMIKKWGATG